MIRKLILIVFSAQFLWGCSSLPANQNGQFVSADIDTSNSRLTRWAQAAAQQHPSQSGFLAFDGGIEAFAARIRLIERAEATLDVQYYIWHDDLIGRVLYDRLLDAADRGVRVRLLLDDMDTAGKDETLALFNSHPNLEIRLFNPFVKRNSRWLDLLSNPARLNHRMHNKSITADGIASILGGRNIGDEYFDATENVAFNDMDVLAVGDVAGEVEASFNLYWDSQWAYPAQQLLADVPISEKAYATLRSALTDNLNKAKNSDYGAAFRGYWEEMIDPKRARPLVWGRSELFSDHPDKIVDGDSIPENLIAPKLLKELDNAETDIVIVSPYFVPGKKFTRYLVNRVNSGVRVRVMTNSLAANDVGMVHAGYRKYRKDLLKGGVELYEFKSNRGEPTQKQRPWRGASLASLHGKFLGIDGKTIFVGSFNMDARSVSINTELGVLFESRQYGEFLSTRFDKAAIRLGYKVDLDEDNDLIWETEENGEIVRFDREPLTSWWQRFSNRFMSFIVPESQL